MNNTAKARAIDDLLSGVPSFACVEGCADCCGVVHMTPVEWFRIKQRTGLKALKFTKSLSCPLLDSKTKKCSVYDIRPAICRVFGASDHHRLVCPHGRTPAKKLTVNETDVLMGRVESIGGKDNRHLYKSLIQAAELIKSTERKSA